MKERDRDKEQRTETDRDGKTQRKTDRRTEKTTGLGGFGRSKYKKAKQPTKNLEGLSSVPAR